MLAGATFTCLDWAACVTQSDSINVDWRNASFRGYADYMRTPEFERGLEELIQLAKQKQISIMFAEAVPWRCDRSLIVMPCWFGESA